MSSPSPSTPIAWIAGLPMPKARTEQGFGIELAVVPDGDRVPSPLVDLGDTGHFSRVLLARLCGRGGATVALLALKVQRDAYRALGDTPTSLVNNREIDAMWHREGAHLRAMAGRGVPDLVAGTGDTDDSLLPPLAYDRGGRRMFTAVCPTSWQPLEVCRDDTLLRDAGLEPWSTSTARYLYSPTATGTPTFYTWSTQEGQQAKPAVRVRRRHQLYTDLAAAWAALTKDHKRDLATRLPDLAVFLQNARAEAIEQQVVPLNFYTAHAFALELQDLHFDEYCDLVGGAPFDDLAARVTSGGGLGRSMVLDRLRPRLQGERRWLSASWVRGDDAESLPGQSPFRLGRLGLESAFLKLHAFLGVCRAVRAFHTSFGRPHLGLSSDNAMLTMAGDVSLAAPAHWCFQSRLVDVGEGHRLELQGLCTPDSVPEVYLPSVGSIPTYQSPLVQAPASAREVTVQASAKPRKDGDTPPGLTIELKTSLQRIEGIHPGDVARIQPDAALPGTGEEALLGILTAVDRDRATVTVQLDGERGAALPDKAFAFTATARFHRRLQAPCDLFGLGMLLARAMLANDERDVFAVREVWDRILDKMNLALSNLRAPDPKRIEAMMASLLDGERAHLGSESVLWSQGLRRQVEAPIPGAIWNDLLQLMGRLLTHHRGFSFAAHHGDVPEDDQGGLMDAVIGRAETLFARLYTELVDSADRDQELADIAAELIREASSAMITK